MNKLAGLFGPEQKERESLALGRDMRWHGGIPVCRVQAEVLTEGP